MADGIRAWLTGIISAAMLAALIGCITPQGTVGKIGKMLGGIVLMLSLLRPVAGIDLEQFSQNLTLYRAESGNYIESLEKTNTQLRKNLIEEKSAAYIEEQAQIMGIVCHADIFCKEKDGIPYPYEALITGVLTAGERERIQHILEADLAIAPEQIYWKTEEA